MNKEGIFEGLNLLIWMGIAVFVIALIVALNYSGQAQSGKSLLTQSGFKVTNQSTTLSGNAPAVNDMGPNALVLTAIGGSTTWISASNPLLVTVTGCPITTYAANTNGAVCSGSSSNTYKVTSTTTPTTLDANGAVYKTLNVTLSNLYGNSGAVPSVTVTLQEQFLGANSVVGNFVSNTLVANMIANVATGTAYGAYTNYTTNAGNLNNTFGTNINLAVFALVFIIIVLIVLLVVRNKSGSSGGYL